MKYLFFKILNIVDFKEVNEILNKLEKLDFICIIFKEMGNKWIWYNCLGDNKYVKFDFIGEYIYIFNMCNVNI